MENSHTEIRIYAACLAAYNNGHLHGKWIDANQDAENIMSEIQSMLAASPIPRAEEHAIHDYEGFCGMLLSEHEGIEQISELAAFIAEHGDLGGALLAHFHDLQHAKDAISDHYAGCYDSAQDFARELTEETQNVPDHLAFYINYEAMARDLRINDIFVIETSSGECHVFWSH